MKQLNFALRISVIDKCNFACRYCPNVTSMENYCPVELKSNYLSPEQMISQIKTLLSEYSFSKIVITGGEPTLNPNLCEILRFVKETGHFIELDTNGSLFSDRFIPADQWRTIFKYIDGIKISLDSLNRDMFCFLTQCKSLSAIDNTLQLIDQAVTAGLEVTINTVYTKKNCNDIIELVDYVISRGININILDLYWNRETNQFWQENYLSTANLEQDLERRYGKLMVDESIFGCDFGFIYYTQNHYIKIKRSSTKTMRDKLCDECDHYCQEGLFSLRMSCQGFVTGCQSSDYKHGCILRTNKDLENVAFVIRRLEFAELDINSFGKMLNKNNIGYVKL